MAKKTKYLLIASSVPYTGKSATILGLAHQLQQKGYNIGYSKPLGTCFQPGENVKEEQDLGFIATSLGLSENQIKSPLLFLDEDTIKQSLEGKNTQNYADSLDNYFQEIKADLLLLEGAGDLKQGSLFNLSIPEIATRLEAQVLLVVKYDDLLLIDEIIQAKITLGDRLLGVLINSIPPEKLDLTNNLIKSFLSTINVEVLGMLPSDRLLRSVSVREIVTQLNAKVLCREDRLDLMVETLTVGAMNVNSALEYFRQRQNMAVITGGDRTDLQLAALESSTNCLILTGNSAPQQLILARANDLEIPILSVNLDTLTTVEIVDQTFGKVRLHETIKVQCIQELIKQHFNLDRLTLKLQL
jgi:BioD-like phosphotransacetylase family protein